MTLFLRLKTEKNGEYPWVDPFFARKKTSSPAKGNNSKLGSVLFMEIVVDSLISVVYPPRDKHPQFAPGI